MSALFIGDAHADKLSHLIPNFTNLVMRTLKRTMEEGIQRGVSQVFLAGDIFDTPFPSQTSIVKFLKTITSVDVEVVLLLGNHDASEVNTHSLQIIKWLETTKTSNVRVVLKPTTFKIDDVKILALPHPYVQDLPKGYDFGLAHFAVNGAKADNGFTVRSKHAPKGNWLLGDFHAAQAGRSLGCKYEYLGSLTQLSFEESTKKSVVLIEDGEKIRIPVRPSYVLKKIKIEDLAQLEQLDDTTFYYVQFKPGVIPPTGWMHTRPNVIKTGPIAKLKDKRSEVLLEGSDYILNPLKKLPLFLEDKKYSAGVIKRAVKIAETLRS